MKILTIFSFLIISGPILRGQPVSQLYAEKGEMIIAKLSSAMFPHAKRDTGYWYNGKNYAAESHYRDSSVAIFIPKGFKQGESTNFVIYIHGWYNNIDSTFAQFRIAEQITDSKINAILIHPEGPKNAPDSFGGKLEESDGFKRLMDAVLDILVKDTKIKNKNIGSIILAGHSGAYRVMSFILLDGGLTQYIKEVYLFDALYGQTEKFTYWLDHSDGRLIDIYTEDGGTKQESRNFMTNLQALGYPFLSRKESDVSTNDLLRNRIVFISSNLKHNDVISKREQFQTYLQTSILNRK
jgi:hypothetical protein